jgi:3-deoxy-D-manno-octulosonic acid kinase
MTLAPAGYTRFLMSGADVVALGACAEAVRRAIGGQSLYAYGATHPGRRELRGRGIAYAVTLPDGKTRVVIRHSRHGGLLAPVTGDRFLPPTRAPHELRTALRLAETGVPTPEVIAYATYRAGAVFRRSDVATREVVGGKNLVDLLAVTPAGDGRQPVFAATADLLRALERAGARHPDLNLANVLVVAGPDATYRAYVLDVDRVVFGQPGDPRVGAANVRRLVRSARKLAASGRIAITDDEMERLAAQAGHPG